MKKTLAELLAEVAENVKGGKKITTENRISIYKFEEGGIKLIIYEDGSVLYQVDIDGKNRQTSFHVNDIEFYYIFADGKKVIPKTEYENWNAVLAIRIFAEQKISRNIRSNQRKRETPVDIVPESKIPFIMNTESVYLRQEEKRETREKVSIAVSQLNDCQKEAVILRYYKEMKLNDVAKELRISRSSVNSRLQGALKKLKKSF